MEWIGAPGYNHDLCLLSQKTGITSAEQWLASKTAQAWAAARPGSTTDDVAKVLKEAIALPMRLITGYKGTADIRVAVESGEVDGLCGFSWVSVRTTWRKAIDSGAGYDSAAKHAKAHPELPKVPLTIAFAKSAGGAPADRSRRSPAERDHLRLLVATRHAEGSRADFAARVYANRQGSRFSRRRGQGEPGNRARLRRGDRASIHNLFKTPPEVVAKLKEVLK